MAPSQPLTSCLGQRKSSTLRHPRQACLAPVNPPCWSLPRQPVSLTSNCLVSTFSHPNQLRASHACAHYSAVSPPSSSGVAKHLPATVQPTRVQRTMRVLLLLCLLSLGNTKPYQPVNIMDLMKNHDIMMADSDDDDDDDDEDDDDYDDEDCPANCRCLPQVVQCSDQGLISVPEKIPEDTVMIDLQNNDITEIKED
ncbi:Asporin [Oryzias melastigma]|uniref:Asporin n=1 Tax=Oryzias melastigma TaxID=30732 RepID=A0A834KZA2_ORYME|nr:Asporin [Oryzias melastigma]